MRAVDSADAHEGFPVTQLTSITQSDQIYLPWFVLDVLNIKSRDIDASRRSEGGIKRQNASHVTTSTASNQAPFASALQPQPSAISTHLQTHNRDFSSKASWPRQLQMPTLTSNSSTSSISIPSTSPSETTIGNPTNAVIKISKPYLVMQSARKPLLCQRKTIAAL